MNITTRPINAAREGFSKDFENKSNFGKNFQKKGFNNFDKTYYSSWWSG